MRKLSAVACLTMLGFVVAGFDSPAAQDKPKFTISEVMQQAHKGGLLKSVQEGKANDKEAKLLVEYYTALTLNTPPKGDEKAWKKQTETMLEGAKLYASGKKDEGAAALKKAINCGKCHGLFKG
jgi:surface antigen